MSDEYTYSVDGPICPYCGHKHRPSEEPEHYYSESSDTSECGECGKEFRMSVFPSHSWTCEPLDA